MEIENAESSRGVLICIVYFSLFLDNVLLTVVVPVIPDYLCTIGDNSTLSDENGRVAVLLSSKAFVQLILNLVVGSYTAVLGYARPLFFGNLCLLLSATLFAFGQTYKVLFIARSVQGISSACIGVSGMSLVASQYPEQDKRSKVMGFVLGSIAMGVLLGYPMGSVLYDLEGKMAPFLLVCLFATISVGFQLFHLDFQSIAQTTGSRSSWMHLLSDVKILIIIGAICCSTSPMAILEPCLPIWLTTHIKPKKWQLGTVFIPDSLGYFIGTNFFGIITFCYGRSKSAILSMVVISISTILIPSANTMIQLIIPHFGLGLGIGIVDAALVPLLASMVNQDENFGPIYSLQQVAVSLAYFLGPIVGGEMVKSVGFQWVMRITGLVNLAYCPLLIYLQFMKKQQLLNDDKKDYSTLKTTTLKYDRFRDVDDGL